MRLLAVVLVLAAAARAEESADAKAARELFEAMEKKLVSAKSLHVVCRSREARENGDRHDVTIRVRGACARLDFDWWAAARGKVAWSSGTDGRAAWSSLKPGAEVEAGASPAAAIARGFARTGAFAMADVDRAVAAGRDPGDGAAWATDGFRLGKKESKDGVELQAVEYTVQRGKEDPLRMTLWIDTKTSLPRRRDVDIGGWKLTETYETLELDAKLEDDVFRAPK